MDSEAHKMERQKALEEKRMKLEKLKREREERTQAAAASATTSTGVNKENKIASRAEVDDLVNSLLGNTKNGDEPSKTDLDAPLVTLNGTMTVTQSSTLIESSGVSVKDKMLRLSINKAVVHVSIPPIHTELYDKATQTELVEAMDADGDTSIDSIVFSPLKGSHRRPRMSTGSNSNDHHHRPSISPTSPMAPKLEPTNSICDVERGGTKKIWSIDEITAWENGGREAIINSPAFEEFVNQSGRLIERAINQINTFDILQNYISSDGHGTKRISANLLEGSSFVSEHSTGRPVMDIQFSPHTESQSGLFLVAYGSISQDRIHGTSYSWSDSSGEDIAGLVCLWQTAVPTSPEKRLLAPSAVLAAQFHCEDQNLVIGCCQNGQIVLWDLRNSSPFPVQRSSLAGRGHRHPVYSMVMAPSAASYELITISTDGHLCHWDIQRLAEPVNSVFVSEAEKTNGVYNTLSVASTVLGHTSDGTKEVIVGSENGKLYRLVLPHRSSDSITAVNAHQGLISSMHRNPSGSKFLKDLLLTSSLDWTIKLWNVSDQGFNEPLLELVSPTYDYVCDVKWSPVNSALFTTITSGGMLTLWDLSKSILEPQDSLHILKDSSSSSQGLYALNKLAWSIDGMSIYVGDTKGCVQVLAVKEVCAKGRAGDAGRAELAIMSKRSSGGAVSALELMGDNEREREATIESESDGHSGSRPAESGEET